MRRDTSYNRIQLLHDGRNVKRRFCVVAGTVRAFRAVGWARRVWHPACAGSGSRDASALLSTIDLLRKSLFPYLLLSLFLSLCIYLYIFYTLFMLLITVPLSFMHIYMSISIF